ncbi:MAG TPA: hypothetical protein VLA74_10045 [Nitrososphaeraceae archaeon]|nr:hypothetical protein [Nitrososphaeraceae archaeon]
MNQINKQQQEEKKQIVNGVNVSKLFETVEVIKEKPDIVKFNLKAKGKWIKGGHNSTTINEFMLHVRISKEVNHLSLKKMNHQYY